jgi:hypothetical protein
MTMKEFAATARNIVCGLSEEGDILPRAELIIVVSEPQYRLGPDDLIRERVSESYRIQLSRAGAKMLIQTLMEIDKELESLEKRYPKEKENEP